MTRFVAEDGWTVPADFARRWRLREVAEVGGLRFAVGPGAKAAIPGHQDMVLWWLTPQGWRKVPMSAAALLADFFVENETATYRAHWSQSPWDYFAGYLAHAISRGWRAADAQLQRDRANGD